MNAGEGGTDAIASVAGRLRDTALRSWRDSPTRLTEDTNAEWDLRVGAYRDRVFVELAANAADAAARTGSPGRIRIRMAGGELRVANTGAELDEHGVAALASLRASAKAPDEDGAEETVGRFGVGFAAVLAVTAEPRVASGASGVAFSGTRTGAVVRGEEEHPLGPVAPGASEVPVLRLPWPLSDDEPPPPEGFDTEVRLPLRPEIDTADLLDRLRAEVADVLLMLPWLAEVEIEGETWTRVREGEIVELTAPDENRTRWLTERGEGCVWAVPVHADGEPVPRDDDVLHAPTPTDERLSLPARLLCWSVPVEPSRRRVRAGADAPGVRRALRAAAAAYPDLVRRCPARYRPMLVPRARFPLSDVDAVVRDLVLERLTADPWLPAATEAEPPGATESEVPGVRARVLAFDAPELVGTLAGVVPGLVAAPLCGPAVVRALSPVGARALSVAELVESVTGVRREPSWWTALYEELFAAVERREIDVDDLGALPVPLVDGRTVPGPRSVLVPDDDTGLLSRVAALEITGLHLVDPEAAHPLLDRLGAVRAGPGEVLRSPVLVEAVHNSVADALAGVDVHPLVEAVLRLVDEAGGPSAGPDTEPDTEEEYGAGTARLGALALPSVTGWRRADELLLPDAALLAVLDSDAVGEDAPLEVLDTAFAECWRPEVLTAVGVLDTFRLRSEGEYGGFGAEEDLSTEDGPAPEDVDADELPVADLDLVAEECWPEAIRLLAARRDTWHALTVPGGRMPAWLAAHARLAGHPPRDWRLPSATPLAGLFDPVPDVGLGAELLVASGVRTGLDVVGPEDAERLCARLADSRRTVGPGLVLRAHTALAAVPAHDIEPPDRVRVLDGTVADAADVVVLDAPWLLGVRPPGLLVAARDYAEAAALADVLDLPLASEEGTARVDGDGEFAAWRELPAIVEAADLLGVDVPDGGVTVHTELTVDGRAVPWWFEPADEASVPPAGVLPVGTAHAADSPEGLARAFAWAAGRWSDRVLITALVEDPDPRVVLG